MAERVLVVDDEEVLRNNMVRFLTREGHAAEGAASAEQALERLAEGEYALVITDLRMPGMGGLSLLERLESSRPETMTLVITAYASLDSAIAALRAGARDYLLKPLSLDELALKVGRLLEHRSLRRQVQRLRRELRGRFDTAGMVAGSPAMQRVLALVERAAPTTSTVLIQGESGTGKELVARALHDRSPRAGADFIPVNLAARPADLVDATLFGHERGAFTGADRARAGVFRAAEGGTVFLDEVSELPAAVQVKLLRVLESREVLPLGSERPVSADFRLVVATNRPLEALVASGDFRQDLYYRLNVLQIDLPPLRERVEDIAPLADHFLARHAAAQGRPAPRLSDAAARALEGWRWPGNVRELSNAMERAVLLCDGDRVTPAELPPALVDGEGEAPLALKPALERFERGHIQRVLAHTGGDKVAAAELLEVHLATLYRHMERLGL
jgi:two-component system response regulator AtoC